MQLVKAYAFARAGSASPSVMHSEMSAAFNSDILKASYAASAPLLYISNLGLETDEDGLQRDVDARRTSQTDPASPIEYCHLSLLQSVAAHTSIESEALRSFVSLYPMA